MAIELVAPAEVHPAEAWTHLYRVGFWRQQTPPPGSDIPPEQMGWGVELWDLRAEDVHEVIAWADAKAGADRIYTLYVRLEDGHGPGEDCSSRSPEPIRLAIRPSPTGSTGHTRCADADSPPSPVLVQRVTLEPPTMASVPSSRRTHALPFPS